MPPCRAVERSRDRSFSPSRCSWCACSSAFSLVVYDYASGVARDRFAEALNTLSRSVMTNLDAQVAEMNRLSLTIIYSRVFQGLYARHLALPRSPGLGRAENRQAGEHGGADRDQRDDSRPQPLRAAGQRLRSSGRDDRRRLLQPPHRAGREDANRGTRRSWGRAETA